jgi:hypothetical protein
MYVLRTATRLHGNKANENPYVFCCNLGIDSLVSRKIKVAAKARRKLKLVNVGRFASFLELHGQLGIVRNDYQVTLK